MTTAISTTSPGLPNNGMRNAQMRFLIIACVLGVAVGVLFIVVQPWIGMDTLTSRHAAAYQQLGSWSAFPAFVIAWFAHLAVSVFYGLLCGIVVLKYVRLSHISLFTLAFSWITTVIAPPANAIIVQLVSFQHIKAEQLPGLNFNFDAKFMLHLGFFVVITVVLYACKYKLKKI